MSEVDISVVFILPVAGPQIVQNWIQYFALLVIQLFVFTDLCFQQTRKQVCCLLSVYLYTRISGWSMPVFLKKSSSKTQLFITQAIICYFTACTFPGSRRIIATERQHAGPSPKLRAKSAEFPSQNLKIPLTFPVMCAHFRSKTVLES